MEAEVNSKAGIEAAEQSDNAELSRSRQSLCPDDAHELLISDRTRKHQSGRLSAPVMGYASYHSL